jgi:hypothetical protein
MNIATETPAIAVAPRKRAVAHRGLIPRRRLPSKISSLPAEIRNQLNQSIHDGARYSDLIKNLAAQGHPGFTRDNFTRWYRAGYQDWLAELQRTQDTHTRTESALGTLRRLKLAGKGDLADANDLLLANQLHEILRDFDPASVKDNLATKPEQFFRLATAIINQTGDRTARQRIQLELDKFRDHVAKQKTELEKAAHQTNAEGGLPPEIVRQIQIAIAGL